MTNSQGYAPDVELSGWNDFMQKVAVTIPEATAMSGLGRTFLYKLFNEGKLTPRKAGKRTLILVSELEAYLNNLPKGGAFNAA
nr:helix-turn-helix domain-containing protein [uncultured Gellertiella sp.]